MIGTEKGGRSAHNGEHRSVIVCAGRLQIHAMRLFVPPVFLFLAAGILSVPALHGQNTGPREAVASFEVSKKNFVVRGSNLSKVEIYYWPTGTGIDSAATLGMAKRVTPAGKREVWVLPVPPKPTDYAGLLAVRILAVGIDATGKAVGTKSLPYDGATGVYEGLWSSGHWYQIDKNDSGEQFTYSKGESFDLILWEEDYPARELSLSCLPVDTLKAIPDVPQVFGPLYTVRYEGVKKGICRITNRSFTAAITVQ